MKDQITISISSVSGSRHWHIDRKKKQKIKAFAYTVASIVAVILCVSTYLYVAFDNAHLRNSLLIKQSSDLNDELVALNSMKQELEDELLERESQVALVSDRLADIELLLSPDIQKDDSHSLEERLNVAAVEMSTRVMMLSKIPNGSPVGKARISSGFGARIHPVTREHRMHRGLDFAVNTGTNIYAPADGVVEVTRRSNEGSGNFLRVQHAYGFSSSYSHLHEFKVRSGQFVRKGDLIAVSGNSGLSSGPHLHYEVRFVGRALDPLNFVEWGLDDFESIIKKEKLIPWDSLINTVELRLAQLLQPSSQKVATLAVKSK
ncbi:membrane protein [Vibrio astriarenae]|nr:membrane protein [Vibrio sp. C7]